MSPAFNNILVVQDAYHDSIDAIEWASQMVSPTGYIKILDVQPPLGALWRDLVAGEFEETPIYHRKKSLSALAEGIDFPTKNVAWQVRSGTPVVQIVRETLSEKYDLVIKEAFSKASDLIFGNLDMRLLRFCPLPVWLARPKSNHICSKILVALNPEADDKEMLLNQRLLKLAASIASGFNCKLFIIGAYHSHETIFPVVDAAAMSRLEKHSKTIRRLAREKIKNLVQERLTAIDQDNIIVENGWPDEVILEAVQQIKPELLVIGSVARHGLSGLMVGNAAERVLRQVNCSVLTVKPQDFVCPIAPDEPERGFIPTGQMAF